MAKDGNGPEQITEHVREEMIANNKVSNQKRWDQSQFDEWYPFEP